MKLKSFKYLTGLLVFILFSPLWSEEKIDIWKNNTKKKIETSNSSTKTAQENNNIKAANTIESPTKIQIEEKIDKSLLAGIKISVDNKVTDHSVRYRLNLMREQILK